jgi:signal transduction histidine kinase
VTLSITVAALAALAGLMVAALALLRGAKSPFALPLTLLGVDQFAWNVATVGWNVTGEERWRWLGAIATPLFIAFGVHLVLVFVGRRRQLTWLLIATYVVCGLQSLLALMLGQSETNLKLGAVLTLASGLPAGVAAIALVAQHARAATTGLERYRARTMLVAIVVTAVLLVTDLLADTGMNVPRLAHLGSFVFSALLTYLTLGLTLLEKDGRSSSPLQALLVGLFAAVAYLALFSTFSGNQGLLVVGVSAVTLGLVGLLRTSTSAASAQREGLERFATLGRFSAQMAHDLKNPLAAAKGATDYLRKEVEQQRPPKDNEFLDLIAQQLDRLHSVIDRYQRMSRLEPRPERLELNALVTRVLALQAFVAPNVEVKRQLLEPSPIVHGDGDLLAAVLENLVTNAFQAMPEGRAGRVTVSTRIENGRGVLAVEDDGKGMDARAVERAFEPFHTTKAKGSGLGLAFSREVARAHGGDARLSSREGRGTLVEVAIPLEEVA